MYKFQHIYIKGMIFFYHYTNDYDVIRRVGKNRFWFFQPLYIIENNRGIILL